MKYENQRPDLADQVKSLVQSANSVKTVPHGIKTVEPGEGLQLLSADGAEIFWDWETAQQWDTSIQEGRAAIEQARADLDKAEQDLAAGTVRLEENRQILDALAPQVAAASTAAEQTSKDLTTLQGMTKRTVDAAAALGGALAVGYETSVLPAGSDGTAATGWTNLTVSTDPTAAAGSGYPGSFYTQTNSMVFSDYVPVVAGDTYLWHVSAKADQPGSNWYVQIWQLDASGASVAPNPYVISRDTMPTVWTDYSGTYTVPATVTQVRMQIYPLHGTGTTTSGTQRVTGMSLRRKVPGDVAVNGGITALAVNAEKVSGALGQFLKVEAQSGTFTDSLTGRNARLLGETVAESINITGKLRGRDAILSGTVDVGQLNVTGAMSAEIVRAMDITARRGIFTEGLTAQDSTLLGTTVAEVINAGTVATRIMTSGLLQTTTASDRGVKIDNAGIRAWDDTGQQTVQINGRDNLVQGAFRTGTTGARIGIDSNADSAYMNVYGPRSTTDHGSIIYTAGDAGPLNASLTLMAMGSYSGNPNNPALRLFPLRGTFAFQGRWARDTDPVKFIVLTNSAGLDAGQYNTIDVPYGTAFPTNNALRFPFVSVESANGADVMATIVTQTDKMIRINVINKSGSRGSGALVVKIATFNVGAL